jgi:hypothetical protein
MAFERVCLVSLNAYHRIRPDSFFRRILKASDLRVAKNSLVFLGFSKLFKLAKERRDYLIILKLIERDVDGIYEMLNGKDIERFQENFKKLRSETESEILDKFEKYLSEEEGKI